MNITLIEDFKANALQALLKQRENFSGSDEAFAKQFGINKSVFSRLKNGEQGQLLSDAKWLNIGRLVGVSGKEKALKTTRTAVLSQIQEEVEFCQAHSKAMMFVDDCEIGKTVALKYLQRNLKNCFYVDGSECKTKQRFTRKLAEALGLDNTGKYLDVKEDIKFYLKMLPNSMVLIDDGGDLKIETFLDIKEYWNSTEWQCGWYLVGDDSLEAQIERGIRSKKPGYRAFFSRFSSTYSRATPLAMNDKIIFYKQLLTDVLKANLDDVTKINKIVASCLKTEHNGHIGGLRRAESLLILNS